MLGQPPSDWSIIPNTSFGRHYARGRRRSMLAAFQRAVALGPRASTVMDCCKGESTPLGRMVKSAVDLDRLIEDFGCWQEVCVGACVCLRKEGSHLSHC